MKQAAMLSGSHLWLSAAIIVLVLSFHGTTEVLLDGPLQAYGVIEADHEREDKRTLFQLQVSEMLQVEDRLTEEVMELANAARRPELQVVLEQKRKESALQADRLRSIMDITGLEVTDVETGTFDGLMEDARRMIEKFQGSDIVDEILVSRTRRIEHFEISAYADLIRLAGDLEFGVEVTDLLEENLREDRSTDSELETFTTDRSGAARMLEEQLEEVPQDAPSPGEENKRIP